ncbi:hypothetical protein [Paralcaligenes ureilyticus]|uniref:Uncharacterized protein n=1 Tax=Paralcaligenes ureilyticus TaxID=627131 RepID=A0A4R3MBZ7_9BURK|nr:hypothetical protein [Paralcaligenes ureilyticus]TCT09487.1 hypothetical protein EDC26_103105 [Paralcaligenes ureilyticus]
MSKIMDVFDDAVIRASGMNRKEEALRRGDLSEQYDDDGSVLLKIIAWVIFAAFGLYMLVEGIQTAFLSIFH